jgi:hypothetical protein
MTLAFPLRCALEGWEKYTLLLSDSKPQATEHLRNIKHELEDNDRLAITYPRAVGEGPVWRDDRIQLRNGAVIEALGTGSKIRGRKHRSERPSLVVFDDPQSNEDITSPTMRERAWQWAVREVIPAGDENTNFLSVGSALHREAVSVRLGQLAGWNGRTYRAIHSWPSRTDLWREFDRMATNLADDNRLATARAFFAENRLEMETGAVTYWPSRFNIEALMIRRTEIGSAGFESEYQGTPGVIEGSEWPPELFTRSDFWFDNWPAEIIRKVQGLDPSKGASDKADYQAHVLVALQRWGEIYVDCELHREPRWVERAIELYQLWDPVELIAESNNTMGLMRPAAMTILEQRRRAGLPAKLNYNERTNTVPKVARIRRLSEYLRRGNIHFRNTPGCRLLVEQLRDFPRGQMDDAIDALATAMIRLEELSPQPR